MRRLTALLAALLLLAFTGCAANPAQPESTSSPAQADETQADFQVESAYPLEYAKEFTVDECTGGTRLITIQNARYLVVPENSTVPNGLSEDITVLQKPLENVYLVSTSAMDPILKLDARSAVTLSGTSAENWYLPEAKEAMENGEISYAGKYSAPDYETIYSADCNLAIENTMIYHTPEVIEQLERIGIPVLIERSSYEPEPLGRMEWLKLYAALLGREDAACAYYDDLIAALAPVLDQQPTGQTVAFFYITTSGAVNVRKSGDYIAKAIRMAGGEYVSFDESGEENALSTMTIQMESFYDTALDADVLIYNSTIDGEITSIDELLAKSPLFADFKAVQTGNVWCITKNFYQESLALGDMILDVHAVLNNPDAADLRFLKKLS